MKTIVIYHSLTGFTKQYALWIAEELNCEAISLKKAETVGLNLYDRVIFATYLYMTKISKLRWITMQPNKNKMIVLVGASPVDAPNVTSILAKYSKGEFNVMRCYYVQGGLCYEKMILRDKMLLGIRNTIIKISKGRDSTEYEVGYRSFEVGSRSFDASSKTMLDSFFADVNG